MENRQFTCYHVGCDKAFARKEHLARHAKSHNPANMFQCQVCKRNFNRNDSLQRHIVKHGAVFKQNPSGRSKRACLACRSGKTKCDGEDSCAKCVKRGIECRYGQEDQRAESPDRSQTAGSPSPVAIAKSPGARSRPTIPPAAAASSGLVDWTAIQIRPDPQGPQTATEVGIDDIEVQKYLDSYFEQFHHRWPIIHRPSHEEEVKEADLCVLSMKMIGGWILGTTESIQFASETHNVLAEHITSELRLVTSHDRFQQTLPTWMCQAAILNIIFGFYYGNDREVSRAIFLWNILVTALRDVGFFREETAWPDDKAGYFLPMRLVKQQQRQRMAYTLFKLSSYISLMRDQPMTLLPEELHYPLPCTFASWNCDGLHVFEQRQSKEPYYRGLKSMYGLITDDSLNTDTTSIGEQEMTIEDIHLCLCAFQSNVWKHIQTANSSTTCDVDVVLEKDSLRRHLKRLKSRLDRILAQEISLSNADFGHETYLPYRYYYGYEDHTQPGWQDVVSLRVKSMLFDTAMLHFLLSLHLSVNIRKLAQIAKDQRLESVEELSEVHGQARKQRQTYMQGWTFTHAARWALCQSIDVLVAYQECRNRSGTSTNVRSLDPICHAALCTSALVVWAFCNFSDADCTVCTPESMPIIELTTWSMPGNRFAKERESWMEMGKRGPRYRPQVQGIQLCQCNTEFIMAIFQACLPHTWDIADSLAPGIFKTHDSLV